MTALNLAENPFRVFTPEDMEATDVAELFVNPPDANKIGGLGHTMLNGARGCGKSMIFRYLLSDCQMITLKKSLNELPFLAFLVSIKNIGATPALTEFHRLEYKHANIVLNEHVLTVFAAAKVFSSLSHIDLPENEETGCEAVDYFEKDFKRRMEQCGSDVQPLPASRPSPARVFEHIADVCKDCYSAIVRYAKRIIPDGQPVRYTGALCDYLEFLFPLLNELKRLSFLPSSPVYLLIDDADYLSRTQTIVLNSWISTRTQADVSIKVSTQLHYKTFQTMSGLPIQSPHDFQKVDISDLYTTRRGRYLGRVKEIVSKRLAKAGIKDSSPRNFFPNDEKQERAIREIENKIRSDWPKKGKGHRASDDVVRYARPDYIRSLGGKSKSTSTYSYSGFEQLVHISSGLIRYFLESAAVMFDDQRNSQPGQPVTHITPKIQNQVARHRADQFMLSEFDQMAEEKARDQLRNLIRALGGTFYLKLISQDSERRIFSVAISGVPGDDVLAVLDLGVRYGYFHRSTIGNKEGTGRSLLYVLTRRLAPHFKLDPSSFAGYLWITNDMLRKAMSKPDAMLGKVRNVGVSKYFKGSGQLNLFERNGPIG